MKTAEEILNDCEFDNRNIVLNSREYRNMIIEAMEEYASQPSDVSDAKTKPLADINSIMEWLSNNGIGIGTNLTVRGTAGLIQSFIAQWVLPIPKTIEFPNDTYELGAMKTANNVITEIDKCECGHVAPLGFIHWNEDGNGTCVNCVNDILIDRLVNKNKQIKSLRAKLKALRDGKIKKGE